ncbi:MAG: hypothetical protein BroJett038_33980 [Chloroflexota bacterium]|nr:MAG: hypothetical protein BroJett038_33980 [Chloroflexota bacterium]
MGTVAAENDFSLRPVTADDLPAVLAVYQQSEDFLALGTAAASPETVQKDLALSAEAGGIFYGIFDRDGLMRGVLDVIPAGFGGERFHAFIELLMIAQPYRGAGLGARVLAHIEQSLYRDHHARAVLAAVQTNNPAALRFWARQGYNTIGAPELQPDGTTTVMLRKTLDF